MKRWHRTTIAEVCGRCGRPLTVGDAELLYLFDAVRRPLHRCAACAGEPVPADLPPLEPIAIGDVAGGERAPRSLTPPRDWKARQAGDAP